MIQQIQTGQFIQSSENRKLPATLLADITAAGISASLVSPVITVIDRSVVENATFSKHPLLSTLRSHFVSCFRHPQVFFTAKPFIYVWTLYAATYSTANSVESVAKAIFSKADQVLINSITFLSTCIVNVPLGVWKDVRFVQTYGQSIASNYILRKPLNEKAVVSTTRRAPVQPVKVPSMVGATFLLRDAITIFGSINLPPMLSPLLSDTYFVNPAMKLAALQLSVPVLSQVVATPVHLLALDLYNNPQNDGTAPRVARMRRSLAPTTAMRCSRIIPAFGIGLVANTGLRNYFHETIGP